ncbi:MAG: alpha/beta hydrolase [Chloroflexota bacterium]|nr:alpha/beta hydrolase [Chloroflexota bacterium]
MSDDQSDVSRVFELLDQPEVVQFLFYPRRDFSSQPLAANATVHMIPVEEGISVSCRFYPVNERAANVLYFHGNGEVASDYDHIAPLFNQIGVNLFVADYRGYGSSEGRPTFSAMMKDAHPIFDRFGQMLTGEGYTGGAFVMGRSLGSAPAIELASTRQGDIKGLIIESGFATVGRLMDLVGVAPEALGLDRATLSFNAGRVRSVTIPTLIIHGEYDNLIPLQHGLDLYENSGSSEKKLLIIPSATHNDIFLVGMEDYLGVVREFVTG